MKWLFTLIFKLEDFIKRETWWRKYYYRVVFTSDKDVKPAEHCNLCDAAKVISAYSKRACNTMADRECPCKSNQILIGK